MDFIVLIILTATLGAGAPFVFLYYRYRKIYFIEVLLGLALLFLTIVVQPIIQLVPIIVYSGKEQALQALGVLLPLYLALVSGFFQEGVKTLASKTEFVNNGFWLGYGFGFGEVLLVVLTQALYSSSITNYPLPTLIAPGYERLLVTVYHMFSANTLCITIKMRKKSLDIVVVYLLLSTIHTLMNFIAIEYTLIQGTMFAIEEMYRLYALLTVFVAFTILFRIVYSGVFVRRSI